MANDQSDNPRPSTLRVLFPTFIKEAWYPRYAAERQALINRVYELRGEDLAGVEYSKDFYHHGYTSYRSRDQLFDDGVFRGMAQFITDCAEEYARQQHWNLDEFELVMTQLWCNINSQYSYHQDHVHPYSQISGVIYLQCAAGSPVIKMKDPRWARWMVPPPAKENRPENTLMASFPPEEGKLFMFPSWLEHGVAQNQGEDDRISMSYNFELRPRTQHA